MLASVGRVLRLEEYSVLPKLMVRPKRRGASANSLTVYEILCGP